MSPDSLNVLTSALRDYCREHVLEEKVILAPSRRVGFQWLDAVARSGQPVFNARADTLRRLALQLASPELERLGLILARNLQLEVLVDGLVHALLEAGGRVRPGGAYLAGLVPSPGLTRTISDAIRELRLAGVDSGSISPKKFEVEQKGIEVRELLAGFERELKERNLADYPMVLRLALERLASDASALGDVHVLMPEDIAEDLRGLELRLWEAFPVENRVLMPADRPCEAPEGEAVTDSMLLRWTPQPGSSPRPAGDGTARVRSAIGEANEVREVFRRCVEHGIPLDQVEVVCTDREVYVPHFYELAVRLLPEGSDELPVTFAEGIPARYSRPGRALAAWLAWAGEGYPQQHVVRMLQDGLLVVPGAREKGYSFARLGAMMRTVPIGAGLDRHADKLGKAAAALRKRLDSATVADPEAVDDEHGLSSGELERMRERAEGLELLRDLMKDIAARAPASGSDPVALLEQGRYFLVGIARGVSKMDAYAREALIDRVDELGACLGEADDSSFDVSGWLADLCNTVRIGGQGPRPGCLYVTGVQQGGHSGRPQTFTIGMDDTRFPGAGLQDALLLDSEREAISPDLSTAARRIDTKVLDFARLCARLRGDVTLSYCCRSLADDREMFPSRVLVSAYRVITGEPVTTIKLDEPPASFAPSGEGACVDMTEWWLWRMCAGEPVESPERVMGENFPSLAQGFKALEARASDEFTEYDGYVPEAGADNDCTIPDGPIMSPSRLGTFAACPMEYFFRYILKIEPPEEFEVDPARWLDPLEQGSLLHAVFCDFIRQLQDEKILPPDFERDREALHGIFDSYVDEMKLQKPPPPDPDVFAIEYRALKSTVDSFLQMEAEACRWHEPVACELAVGVVPEGAGTLYDMEETVEVVMPNGKRVRTRCKLDRVDRLLSGDADRYVVGDYKTGKSERFRKNGPFYQGRFMQGALYPVVGEAALRRMHGEASVVRFEYVFPGAGESKRIAYGLDELGQGMEILSLLCEMIASGCFAFTTEPKDTDYSDYKAAFGDIAVAAVDIKRKMARSGSGALEAYRELRGVEAEGTEVAP